MNNTKTYLHYLLFCMFALSLYSCKEKSHLKEISKIIIEWQDKEVFFPENMVFTQYGQDTVEYIIPESEYKILLYVDSMGCTSCKLQLHKWSEFIKEVDSLTLGKVPVLMFFHPKDKRELTYLLKRDNLATPVCFDIDDKLNSMNKFPNRDELQCFLLDKNNNVVYIGNPIYNPKIKEMYLEQIATETENRQPQSTTVRVEQIRFDLGTIQQGKSATVTAIIHNIGEEPLIVHNIETSCDCTTVEYKEKSVLPESTFEVKITYNADDIGFFDRVVYIYANINDSPITVTLEGEVT